MTSYFLWPHADAWEELKDSLEGKPWVSERSAVPPSWILLPTCQAHGHCAALLLLATMLFEAVTVHALAYVPHSHGTAVECVLEVQMVKQMSHGRFSFPRFIVFQTLLLTTYLGALLELSLKACRTAAVLCTSWPCRE